MPSTQITCIGQYQVCGFRLWELGDDCDVTPVATAAKAYVGTAVARASMSAEIKEGTEVEAVTGCGSVAFSVKDIDRIKSWNVELELILWDYEILLAAIGGTLITAEDNGVNVPSGWIGKTIGWGAPGADVDTQNAVAFELWSRTAYSTGTCSAANTDAPLFIRHIFPRATLQLQDRSFADGEAAYMRFQGSVAANPKLFPRLANLTDSAYSEGGAGDGEGWYGPADTTDLGTSTYAQIFSNSVPDVPTGDCAYVEYDVS